MLPGWQTSRGVTAEIVLAHELGKPVAYSAPLDPARAEPGLFAEPDAEAQKEVKP
jgi:hypothetical protein